MTFLIACFSCSLFVASLNFYNVCESQSLLEMSVLKMAYVCNILVKFCVTLELFNIYLQVEINVFICWPSMGILLAL